MLRAVGGVLRALGSTVDAIGANVFQGELAYIERLCNHRRLVAYKGTEPTVGEDAWIAPSASVVGSVSLGAGSSVWYNAVVRGDVNTISIGDGASIGDNAVVHVADITGDFPTMIGDHAIIDSNAVVHGAIIGEGAYVGAHAKVLDGAMVGTGAVVTAGSVVPGGKTVGRGEVWSGSPARMVRKLSDAEAAALKAESKDRATLAAAHAEETDKAWADALYDAERYEEEAQRTEDFTISLFGYSPLPAQPKLADKLAAVEGGAGPSTIH